MISFGVREGRRVSRLAFACVLRVRSMENLLLPVATNNPFSLFAICAATFFPFLRVLVGFLRVMRADNGVGLVWHLELLFQAFQSSRPVLADAKDGSIGDVIAASKIRCCEFPHLSIRWPSLQGWHGP